MNRLLLSSSFHAEFALTVNIKLKIRKVTLTYNNIANHTKLLLDIREFEAEIKYYRSLEQFVHKSLDKLWNSFSPSASIIKSLFARQKNVWYKIISSHHKSWFSDANRDMCERELRYFPRDYTDILVNARACSNELRMPAYVPNIQSFVVKQDVDYVSTSRSTMLIDASC